MKQKANSLIFHSMASKPNSLSVDIDIARTLGFDGLETSGQKIAAFLDAGFSETELKQRLSGLQVPGIGFLIDLERQDTQRDTMLVEAQHLCHLATMAGAGGIEAITGPLDLRVHESDSARKYPDLYRGVVDLTKEEQVTVTAENLRLVADIASRFGLIVYLEALSWTPLKTLDDQISVITKCGRENVRLVIDFWHCYTAGDTPDRLARLDKDLIYGIHLCDSLPFDGGVPNEPLLRDVRTGEGALDLREWVEAIKSTGFCGWWSCELFCRRDHQDNPYHVAASLKETMADLIRV